MLGRRVTARELRRLREEELDRLVDADPRFEECPACAPEQPCTRHQASG
jgi:hypothetical protein